MNVLFQSPAILLLVTGTLIGFNFPLGKIAGEAGVSPIIWAMLISFGAAASLFPILITKRRLSLPKVGGVRYVVISALISFVIPNILLFSVIPHVGAGYAGLMFALSPVFTLVLAVIFRLQTPKKLGLLGIAAGLVGAALVSINRGSVADAPSAIWILAAILVPAGLATGNIYRTLKWPAGALPDALAFWSHTAAVLTFLLILLVTKDLSALKGLSFVPSAALLQALVAGMTFPVFFRLQQKGGPVLLSQIGYVAAAVGLIIATVILDEEYSQMTWFGAAIIAFGIILTIAAQVLKPKQQSTTV